MRWSCTNKIKLEVCLLFSTLFSSKSLSLSNHSPADFTSIAFWTQGGERQPASESYFVKLKKYVSVLYSELLVHQSSVGLFLTHQLQEKT